MTADWKARPGPEVTGTEAAPGEVRTGANGVQWYNDPARGWQPVVVAPPGAAGRQAHAEAEAG